MINLSKKYLLISLLSILSTLQLVGQEDSILVTKNFDFEDGIYLQLNSLQKNKPDISWKDVNSNLAANPQTFMTQIEFISLKETGDSLNMTDVFAICLGGIPFIRLPQEAVDKELTTFAGLRVRGLISYFNYEVTVNRKVPISAYNPLNGRAFRTGMIDKQVTLTYEKMFHFETGEMATLNKENFLYWIREDKKLASTVQDLEGQELVEKLFKALLIFDDRNPIYIETDN